MKILSLCVMYIAIKCFLAAHALGDVAFGCFGVLFMLLSLVTWVVPVVRVEHKTSGGDPHE